MTVFYRCSASKVTPLKIRWPLRLYMRYRGVAADEALNCDGAGSGRTTGNMTERLKGAMNRWTSEGLDLERGRVDYQNLAISADFAEFRELANELRGFDLSSLRCDNERKAFWINIYNVLLIHGLIAYGARHSAKEVRGVFNRCAYIIGGLRFCLDDIEHGILRRNRMHFVVPGARFRRDDPRRHFVVDRLDPRIHFALVCGASSCPPIGVYQSENLDKQLDLAAHSFISGGGVVWKRSEMTVSLSRIFQWYSVDFGGQWMGMGSGEQVLQYLSQFLIDDNERAFFRDNARNLRVEYQHYDWSLNV